MIAAYRQLSSYGLVWGSKSCGLVWGSTAACVLFCNSSNELNELSQWPVVMMTALWYYYYYLPGVTALASTRMSPFWILLKLRMMKVVVTTGAIRPAKLQSNRYHQQTNTHLFTGRMPHSYSLTITKAKIWHILLISVHQPIFLQSS